MIMPYPLLGLNSIIYMPKELTAFDHVLDGVIQQLKDDNKLVWYSLYAVVVMIVLVVLVGLWKLCKRKSNKNNGSGFFRDRSDSRFKFD